MALTSCDDHLLTASLFCAPSTSADGMFGRIEQADGRQYQLRPMNCPFHCLMYGDAPRSYRELPLRWAELGTVYRHEKASALHGLMRCCSPTLCSTTTLTIIQHDGPNHLGMRLKALPGHQMALITSDLVSFRVRGFTQDDAHIFCLPEQLEDEIVQVLDLFERILSTFGFVEYKIMLSTRPGQSVGSDQIWMDATEALRTGLERKGWEYEVDDGGGAFYGPKIDLNIRDALGRSWQCSTVQCDFNLPERFDLEYTGPDGKKARPVTSHPRLLAGLICNATAC